MRENLDINTLKERVKEAKFPLAEEYFKLLRDNNLEEFIKPYQGVCDISKAVKEAGGRALLVGGSVRDFFLGKVSKDFDLEVYGLEAEDLESLAKKFGEVFDVGKSFGVLKVKLGESIDIDLSLPRSDSKVDVGHRGFEIKTDPSMSTKEAARRRDFTINALLADPLTGEIIDHFGGLKDLEEKKLRPIDSEKFKEDPLRVLRAVQFIARFALTIDESSLKPIKEIIPQLKELPKERIFEEWKKLLLKSEKPSLGLMAALQWGVLKELHPQFPPLAQTKQDPQWHPEGDVWLHTLMSVDEASKLCRNSNKSEKDKLIIMLSTLCHNIGKPQVTLEKDGRITSFGHDRVGGEN